MKNRFTIYFILSITALLLAGCGNADKNPDARDEKNPLVHKALEQIKAQQFSDALKTLEAALDKKPELARADLEAARIYHMDPDNRDYPLAIYHYRRYLAKRPETEKAEVIENWIHQAQLSYASEILRSNPNDFMAEVNRLKRENASLRRLVQQHASAATNATPAVAQTTETESPRQQIANTPAPAPQPTPKLQPAARNYAVQSGDTLSKISRKVYGSSSKWRLIYEANRSVMKSERDLKIGQTLIIPPLGEDEKPRG